MDMTLFTARTPEDVRALVEGGQAIDACDAQGVTPLIRAIKEMRRDLVIVLVEVGADVNAADGSGYSPLDWARNHGRYPGQPFVVTKEMRSNPVYGMECAQYDAIVEYLMEHGARRHVSRLFKPWLWMQALKDGKHAGSAAAPDTGIDPAVRGRAYGCMLGQLAGDALGSQVESMSAEEILRVHSDGVRDLRNGGPHALLAGQPTDDSEMAIMLARSIVSMGRYDPADVLKTYRYWLKSGPFSCGRTVRLALGDGIRDEEGEDNGAMMRVSPLAIFGWRRPVNVLANMAMTDAAITHINPVCRQANAFYAGIVARAIATGAAPKELYAILCRWTDKDTVAPSLRTAVKEAAASSPEDYMTRMDWVVVSFHNAVYQLLHAKDPEEGIVDTVMRGGDTGTNAAIAGALLGAVYGERRIPRAWRRTVLACRPEQGRCLHPRPKLFWAMDSLELVDKLLAC